LSPAASIRLNARYGLQAGSGERNSIRVESSFPFFASGTRTSAERLFRAQHTYTGASYPTMGASRLMASRLYEFTHVVVTAVYSGAWRSKPAMKHLPTFDSPARSPGSWNALTSPSNSERWVCIPDPKAWANGLGMNVAYTPRSCATSFTTRRN